MNITFNLLGGYGQLGNQMFQYALLLGIKYKTNCKIIFNPTTINNSYLFNFFQLTEFEVSNISIKEKYKEKEHTYNSNVFEIKNDTDYEGYYQTEKYFSHCKSIIKKEFTFKKDIEDKAEAILLPHKDKILVSLHIRRGDYLLNPHIHPLCTLEYYEEAMSYFDDNVIFICTSDDISWCKENFKNRNVFFTNNNLETDMCIISKCHHHIIANSSFSWWGAWLGNNENKKIISPKMWLGVASGCDTKDVYCDNWIKI